MILSHLRALLAERDAPAGLAEAALRISERYRAGVSDRSAGLRDERDREAYLAVRMPATSVAIAAALAQIPNQRRHLWRTILDLGSGPGSALWAICDQAPSVTQLTAFERDAGLIAHGQALAAAGPAPLPTTTWMTGDLRHPPDLPTYDVVVCAYALNELTANERSALVAWAWMHSRDTLLLVEPGTPAGAAHLAAARQSLLALNAVPVAPCTHAQTCPRASGPAFCRFAARVPRSRLHRAAKGALRGHEDEPFAFLAMARSGTPNGGGRVISAPHVHRGAAELTLCEAEGERREVIARRDARYAWASTLEWGSVTSGITT